MVTIDAGHASPESGLDFEVACGNRINDDNAARLDRLPHKARGRVLFRGREGVRIDAPCACDAGLIRRGIEKIKNGGAEAERRFQGP